MNQGMNQGYYDTRPGPGVPGYSDWAFDGQEPQLIGFDPDVFDELGGIEQDQGGSYRDSSISDIFSGFTSVSFSNSSEVERLQVGPALASYRQP